MSPNRATCWEGGLSVGCQSAGHFQRPTGPLEAADATAVWLLEQHVKSLTPAARDTAHTAKAGENHSPRGNTDIRTWGSQGNPAGGPDPSRAWQFEETTPRFTSTE